jgi:hypothetical protein
MNLRTAVLALALSALAVPSFAQTAKTEKDENPKFPLYISIVCNEKESIGHDFVIRLGSDLLDDAEFIGSNPTETDISGFFVRIFIENVDAKTSVITVNLLGHNLGSKYDDYIATVTIIASPENAKAMADDAVVYLRDSMTDYNVEKTIGSATEN